MGWLDCVLCFVSGFFGGLLGAGFVVFAVYQSVKITKKLNAKRRKTHRR